MPVQCRACGGVYDDELPDGTRYFHQCPPLRLARVRRADGAIADVALDQVLDTDERLGELDAPRPDGRDENVEPVPGAEGRPKREGRGAERRNR